MCISSERKLGEHTDSSIEEMQTYTFAQTQGSTVSEPHWALHMCDNKCRAKGFKFFEIAAVVSDGGAAHTNNLCRDCYGGSRVEEGEAQVKGVKLRALIEHKSSR